MPNLGTQNLLTTAHLYFLITIDKLVLKCKANVSIFTENHNFIEKNISKITFKARSKRFEILQSKTAISTLDS